MVERELFYEQLPAAFDGYRILHLTDLHIDSLPGIEDAISERVAPLRYDTCVLTGDYRFRAYGAYGAECPAAASTSYEQYIRPRWSLRHVGQS